MATRQETQQRKQALLEGLRAAYNDGLWDGQQALSLRALSEQYQLSMQTVGVQLQQLVREGVLYTVPRVGTFLGHPPLNHERPYLLVSDFTREDHMFLDRVQAGFEERIAQLGGSSFSLCYQDWRSNEALDIPNPAGVMVFGRWDESRAFPRSLNGIPQVAFSHNWPGNKEADTLDFDDEAGAIVATKHLVRAGHRRIAFLGLHALGQPAGILSFSVRREAGWRQFMGEIGAEVSDLAFHPQEMDAAHQTDSVRGAVAELIKREDITAILSVNAFASSALLEGLKESGLPPENWPAIVGFDDTPRTRVNGLTYVRLPWEKVGSEGAQLLWERATGRLAGPPVIRDIPLQLITRLTCRPEWASAATISGSMVQNATEAYQTASA